MFKNGNIYPFLFLPNSLNEPLALISNQNKINCFSNVCTHRAHLVSTSQCNGKKLKCMYHGRTFNLDGSLNFMPDFENVKNFPSQKDNLPSVPNCVWKKFIFASLSGKIKINAVLDDINTRIPNFPFNDLSFSENDSKKWEIDAHWALYCENFLEGFHVPFVHRGLAKDININTYETILIDNGVVQIAKCDEENDILSNNSDKNIYALYYWIFPNMMFNFYSWGLSINIIEPISLSKTRIRFLSYPVKKQKQPSSGSATLDNVEIEDQEVVQNVQIGIKSRLYESGRYSTKHEKGIHHFHLLLSKHLS